MANVNFTGAVNNQTKSGLTEFVFAKLQTQQSTNIAAGDHLKFDTVLASRGSSIALDVATAYSSANGAASVGRVTLKAGLTYRLRATVPYIIGSGATGLLDFQFFDVTGVPAALPGSIGMVEVVTSAANDSGTGVAEAVVTTTQDTIVELRIVTATALSQIGSTGARVPTISVETL